MSAATVIREARVKAGLTQDELADRSGVRQPNIAAYETGTRAPSEEMVRRLLDAARPLPSDSLDAHRAEVIALAAKHKATNVRVFGSVVRGQDTAASDIDLLVTFRPGATMIDLAALGNDLERLLGYPVDIISDRGLRGRRRETNIHQEALVL